MKVKTYKKVLSSFGYRQLMMCVMLAYNYANNIGNDTRTFKEYIQDESSIKLNGRDIVVLKDIAGQCVGYQWMRLHQTMDKFLFDFIPNISKITDEKELDKDVLIYIKEKYYD